MNRRRNDLLVETGSMKRMATNREARCDTPVLKRVTADGTIQHVMGERKDNLEARQQHNEK